MEKSVLGNLTPSTFLAEYWQKKPLLIRNAFPEWASPLTPRELLRLACHDEVRPRLILEEIGSYPWELLWGPFVFEELDDLPNEGWTILVPDVDQYVPTVSELLKPFRFLPNWRIEDVQVSYAPPGGNAGAHVDNYDVFLVQGYGQRRWQIDHRPAGDEAAYVPDLDIELLENFTPDAEWILNPGDLLYLPPRIPHWGIAVNHCMTYSVGFRAPKAQDIMYGLLETALGDQMGRFSDPDRVPSDYPGRIEKADLAWVHELIPRLLANRERIDRWFGRYITERPDYWEDPEEIPAAGELVHLLRSGHRLRRRSLGVLSHIEGEENIYLYGGGEEYSFEKSMTAAVRLITGSGSTVI